MVALQTQVAELQEQLSRARQAEDANRAAVRSLEETLAGQERQRLQQQAHEVRGRVRGHRQAFYWSLNIHFKLACFKFFRKVFFYLSSPLSLSYFPTSDDHVFFLIYFYSRTSRPSYWHFFYRLRHRCLLIADCNVGILHL